MPSNVRGMKVESWKLTPQQKQFQKIFKRYMGVRNMLEMAGRMKSAGLQGIRGLYNQIDQSLMGLYQRRPRRPTRELPGMNFNE